MCVYATNYEIPCTRSVSTFNALLNILSWTFFFSFLAILPFLWSMVAVVVGFSLVLFFRVLSRLYSVVISVLCAFIARVQTFNNEIECNQAKDIENVPQRTHRPTASQIDRLPSTCISYLSYSSLESTRFKTEAAIISLNNSCWYSDMQSIYRSFND